MIGRIIHGEHKQGNVKAVFNILREAAFQLATKNILDGKHTETTMSAFMDSKTTAKVCPKLFYDNTWL
jgi:hypothetical protein